MQMASARAADQIQFLQLYVEKDRAASKVTVEKANELGFSGLFLTVRCLRQAAVQGDMQFLHICHQSWACT